MINLREAGYIKIEDLDLTGSYSSMIYGGNAHDVEVSRIRCHDSQGTTLNNIACINFYAGASTNYIHHSEIFNIYDPASPGDQNVDLVVFFGGQDNRLEYNRLYYTTSPASSAATKGRCAKYKHPGSAGTFTVKGNQMWNCLEYGLELSTNGLRMSNNLLVNPSDYAGAVGVGCGDTGAGVSYCRDAIIEANSFVNFRAYQIQTSGLNAGLGTTIFRKNVVVDNNSNYNSENGFFRIGRYGSDADYATYRALPGMLASENCYYNPFTPVMFDLFADAPSGTGAYLNFSSWKGLGYDSNSSEVNPLLDIFDLPTAGACAARGWRAAGGGGGPLRPNPPTGLNAEIVP